MIKKIRKQFSKLFLLPWINRNYIRSAAVSESIIPSNPEKVFIVTVAFNDAELIALHDASLKKFMRDEYVYCVFDNSNQEDAARAIKDYCLKNWITYIRLPRNPGMDGSLHHGFALNWIYHNFIAPKNPQSFGFMDNDLFPIKIVSIREYLQESDAWGIITHRKFLFRRWRMRYYWWVGLAFSRRGRFTRREPNFLPGFGFDTGGRVLVDPRKTVPLPEVYDLSTPKLIEIAPGIQIHQYGAFIHLAGVAWSAPEVLRVKKEWIRQILK